MVKVKKKVWVKSWMLKKGKFKKVFGGKCVNLKKVGETEKEREV